MNPNVAELSRLCAYPLVRRWTYDWSRMEGDLEFVFPAEYKEYVSYFPPGSHGGVLDPLHPGLREGGLRLAERVRLVSKLFAGWQGKRENAMRFYPDPNGLIPWAEHQGKLALCWLRGDGDPDRWPVYVVNDEGSHELIPGSTIQALIRVLRGEIGRSVFFDSFYEDLESGEPFSFISGEGTPLVGLPEPELLDSPAGM